MTHQKTDALSRLRRIIYMNVPRSGMQNLRPLSSVLCLLSSGAHAAEAGRPAYSPPPPAVSSGSIVQIIFSLLLVLAAVLLVAWLLKRLNVVRQGAERRLKVLGGISVGQRERIVLVEIEDTWLVVGVGPGQIRTLHTLRKAEEKEQEAGESSQNSLPAESKFASLLSSALGRPKKAVANK